MERHRHGAFPFHEQAGESALGVVGDATDDVGPAGGVGGRGGLGAVEPFDAVLSEEHEAFHRQLSAQEVDGPPAHHRHASEVAGEAAEDRRCLG